MHHPVTADGLFDCHTLGPTHQQILAAQKNLAGWFFFRIIHPEYLLAIIFRATLVSNGLIRLFRFQNLHLLSVVEPVLLSGIKNWILTG